MSRATAIRGDVISLEQWDAIKRDLASGESYEVVAINHGTPEMLTACYDDMQGMIRDVYTPLERRLYNVVAGGFRTSYWEPGLDAVFAYAQRSLVRQISAGKVVAERDYHVYDSVLGYRESVVAFEQSLARRTA